MQISTSLFYINASSRLTKMSDKAQELQTQIATGKKLIKPSDDPAGAQQLAELDRRDADAAVYGTNLTLASSLLDQADGVLKQITAQLTRATELATQAATGTQTDAARKSIATEITSVVQSLVTLANSRNVRGQPLFGTVDGTKAVTDNGNGTFTFPANNTLVSEVPIADGQTIQATESAKTLNGGGDVSSSMSTALDSLSQAVDQVANVQASVGSRSARVDLQQQLLTTANTDRADLRGKLEQVDVTDAIVQLQQMMTALSASQASFTKLSQLSLFDYLK
jgi:flagellar hook-associated protein 3 FlgL